MEVKLRKVAKDPICGMSVDENTAKLKSEYKGQTYHFCSMSCKQTFDKEPVRFAKR